VPAHGHLPPPEELASRVSEAKTSANLLIQLSQSTPAAEVQSHELMREFSHRCQAASRSIQSYMAVENPPPDENTLLTLIETNDQLSVALSKYQRTLLNARRALGATPAGTPPAGTPPNSNGNSSGYGSGNGTSSGSPVNGNRESTSPPPTQSAAPLPVQSLNEPFSSTLPTFDAEAPVPAPATTTPSTSARRYQYNADEFAVENPFADNEHAHSS
jgi:GAT domain